MVWLREILGGRRWQPHLHSELIGGFPPDCRWHVIALNPDEDVPLGPSDIVAKGGIEGDELCTVELAKGNRALCTWIDLLGMRASAHVEGHLLLMGEALYQHRELAVSPDRCA